MSGGGYRGRGFGSHGPQYNSPGVAGRDDGSRGGPAGRGYQRENYNSQRHDGRSSEDWSNRRYPRWGEQQIHNQQPVSHNQSWTRHNRGGGQQFQNGPMRYPFRNDGQYQQRGGDGRGFFPRGRNNRFSGAPRGHHNYFLPYYSAPFRENAYDQHEKEPEEPVPPLPGSEEERQQKITEAADELKKKLLSNPSTLDEEQNFWDDDNINLLGSPGKKGDAFVIKPLLELKHGPPELDLTTSDLKDIGRVDTDSTIDPLVTEISQDFISVNNIIRENDEIERRNVIDMSVMEIDNDDHTIEYIHKTSETVGAKNPKDTSLHITTESPSTITRESSVMKPVEATMPIEEETAYDAPATLSNEADSGLSSLHLRNTQESVAEVELLKAANDQSMTELKSSEIMKELSDLSLSTVQVSTVTSLPPAPSETVSNDVHQKSTSDETKAAVPEEMKQSSKSKWSRNTKSLKHKESYSVPNSQQDDLECGTNLSTGSNYSNYERNSPPPQSIQHDRQRSLPASTYTPADMLQPAPAFDPRRRESTLTTIVPEFNPQQLHPMISSQEENLQQSAAFNTHLTSMSPIIPSAPIIGAPVNMSAPMTGFAMGHPGYVMPSYGPAVPMTYQPVITPADYIPTSSLPHPTATTSTLTEQDLNRPEMNSTPHLNEDDVLGELKAAMEFAKGATMDFMKIEDNDEDEEAIEFPTFPDLPPVESKQHSKPKITSKKTAKTKKSNKEVYGPPTNPEVSAQQPVAASNLKTCLKSLPSNNPEDDIIGDDQRRRKVVFNLNSKVKKLSKTDDWAESEPVEDNPKLRRRKLIPLSSPAVAVVAPTTMTTAGAEKTKQDSRESKNSESKKISNSSEQNNSKKAKEQTRAGGSTDRRETKRHSDPKIESLQRKGHQASPTSVRKPEKVSADENVIIDKSSELKNQSTQKVSTKTPTDPTWKDRVIGRFLKMSKNDIQNMINNSSLKKFDIAMQHLVKEKKSSLSLEMRNNEDEKMKSSTYDNENFMVQLQAILDPAATVDITNLPATFIHQLSEVLHLDTQPLDIHNQEIDDYLEQSASNIMFHEEPSTSNKIDHAPTSESSRYVVFNSPAISSREISKLRKIDNRVSKDTVKNAVTTANACSTRTRGKRGDVDTLNVQRSTNNLSSAPSGHTDTLNMDDLDDIFEAGIARAKTIKSTTTQPTPNMSSSTFLEPVTPPEELSPIAPRIETPIVVRVERQAVELDKIFSAGIARAKAASMKAAAVACMEEAQHVTRSRRVARRGTPRGTNANVAGIWRRKALDPPDNYRNLTKEEYEAKFGESSFFYNNEYRKIAGVRSLKNIVNGRENVTHSAHIDNTYFALSPPHLQSQNIRDESESDPGSGSLHNSESSSSSSSSSSSDEEPPSIGEFSKVLKYIKEREKMAKKKTVSEEIRDEVNAEIEKRRKERGLKHKSHKSRSKKREKRKKEKKVKKRKPKKKRRHRSHHSPQRSDGNANDKNERPLRLLREDEIKREPRDDDEVDNPPKTVPTQPRVKNATVTEPILVSKATSTLTSLPTVPTITSPSTRVTSTIKTMPPVNSSSSVVPNTTIAKAKVSSVAKAELTSTATSPLRTITSYPSRTTSPASTQHLKTKAQLKQMPDAITAIESNKVVNKIEPVSSSSSETQVVTDTSNSSLSQQSPAISTTAMMATNSGTKKLNIKAYHERALQRKLKEQDKTKKLVEKPSPPTQDLVNSPLTATSIAGTESKETIQPSINVPTTVESEIPKTIASILPTVTTSTVATAAKKPKRVPQKSEETSQKATKDSIATDEAKTPAISVRQKLTRACKSTATVTEPESVVSDENKFVNIKSEGGKELKLREKVKKRPQKAVKTTAVTDAAKTPVAPSNKPAPVTRSKRRISAAQPENAEEVSKTVESAEPVIKASSSSSTSSSKVSFADDKDDGEVEKSTEEMETDQSNSVQEELVMQIDDSAQQIDDVVTEDVKSMEIDSVKSTDDTVQCDQTVAIEKIDAVQNQVTPSFSHYFQFTERLISDDLPDTVAQERMKNEITQQPEVVLETKIIEVDTSSAIACKLITTELQSATELSLEGNELPELHQEINAQEIFADVEIHDKHNDETANNTDVNFPNSDLIKNPPQEGNNAAEENSQLEDNSQNAENEVKIKEDSDAENEFEVKNEEDSTALAEDPKSLETRPSSPLLRSNSISELNCSQSSALTRSDSTNLINTESQLLHVDTESTLVLRHKTDEDISFDQLSNADLSDLPMDDDEPLTNQQQLLDESLPNSEVIAEPSSKMGSDNLIIEAKTQCEGKENDPLNPDEDNIVDWHQDGEAAEVRDELQQDQAIEESPTSMDSGICYKEFSHQPIVLHDRVLAGDNPRNSFLDDPIAFTSGSKSPTPDAMEFGILGDTDVIGESIYENHQLAEESAVADDEEVTDTYETTSLENTCVPPVQSDENLMKSPSIPDKELLKIIKVTSPERLPSPILEVSSKSSEKDADAANDDEVIDKLVTEEDITKVDSPEPTIHDRELNTTNSSLPASEVPSSTTQINEPASPEHEQCDRSSETHFEEREKTPQRESTTSTVSTPQKEVHRSKRDKNHDSRRKDSSSKSSTPTRDHKKHKKHQYHDKKKHNVTQQKVETLISASIVQVVSKATTKDAVLTRMQEIDLAIQRLMDEKMTLYQMLKNDKWPVNQSGKTSTESTSMTKSSDKSTVVKSPRVMVSRLNDNVNSKRSTVTEPIASKPDTPNIPKQDSHKTVKVVKNDDKRSRHLEEYISKTGKKRKHGDEKGPHKSKEARRDESPEIKKKISFDNSQKGRRKHKSPPRSVKHKDSSHKSTKVNQLFSRESKSKPDVSKPVAVLSDSSDDFETTDHSRSEATPIRETPKNVPGEDHGIIYSDDSTWDTFDRPDGKHERSTALSLLEESLKREMTTKRTKTTESKKKTSSKSSDEEDEEISLAELMTKKQQQRKKHPAVSKRPSKNSHNETTKHVLQVIEAVAKNRINELYTSAVSQEKTESSSRSIDEDPKVDDNEKTTESERHQSVGEKTTNDTQPMVSVAPAETEYTRKSEDSKSRASVSPLRNADACCSEESIPDESEWTTLDSVGFIDDKDENTQPVRNNTPDTMVTERDTKNDKSSSDIHKHRDDALQSPSVREQKKDVYDEESDGEVLSPSAHHHSHDEESQAKTLQLQKSFLADWQDSPNDSDHVSESQRDDNEESEVISTIKATGEAPSTSVTDASNNLKAENDKSEPVIEKPVIANSTTTISMPPEASMSSTTKKPVIEESTKQSTTKEHDERPKRPKSTVKELERSKSTVKELERPKSTVKELERSKSTVKELERSKSTVKELERSKSTVKELEKPKSMLKDLERSKSTIRDLEKSKSTVKEIERPKSTIRELERSKSTVKELEDAESQDDEDNENDEPIGKKRGRAENRRNTPSSRRSSRQSNDSSKPSRSRSRSKRKGKSPSSRDVSPREIEKKKRPASGESSSSTTSRRRSNATPFNPEKTIQDNRSTRRGKKRKHQTERTREQMMSCKVKLIDCKHTYLRPDLDLSVLQRFGISSINIGTPQTRQESPERDLNESILIVDDKNRSDDESMEIIQVETDDYQELENSTDSNSDVIGDPLSLSMPVSPEYLSPPQEVAEKVGENDEVEVIIRDKDNEDDVESRKTQYTVHKGPILDIKVFGDSFFAASEDGAIYRYSQKSNGILNIYKGHDAAVTCLYVHESYGPTDGGCVRWNLFSGSLDTTLRCYDIITGSLYRNVAEVESPIQCMDEAWGVIFIGTKSGHISRYDIKAGGLREDKLDFSDKPVLALRASTEGVRKVLIVASRNQPITIRDAQNGLFLRTISGQRNHTVYSLMRERNLVYCGTSSTSIPVFDFISGEQVTQYTAGVGIVCMRLYRQLLFAGCYDGNIYVFDTKDSRLICSIPGPGNMLLSMEIIDNEIIAGSKDRRLYAWRMPTQIRTILAERA